MENEAGHTLFISDLHLCASRPDITKQFLMFMQHRAPQADALYVLGDLFEYWAGDDDLDDPFHLEIAKAFSTLSASGTHCYFIHGNRDFLIQDTFAACSGMALLPDPCALTLYGHRILLSHGDVLCTDDVAYQAFRQQVRNPVWQQEFLAQPLAARKAHIEALRMRSEQEKSNKAEYIMDVNQAAVNALMRAYDYPAFFIHGHTHRPAAHMMTLDCHTVTRWVLGDWYEQGSCLQLDARGCQALSLTTENIQAN